MSSEQVYFTESSTANLKNQLESPKLELKLTGMKRVIALMSKGEDVEEFFPDIVKNVITRNISLKKMIYLYLLHYAQTRPNEALLSVNNFKKDLNDKNQFIRSLALRVMSGIKVDLIIEIVVNAIKICSGDRSPYVKKAAALAIPKVFGQDPSLKEQLVEVLDRLLGDRNTMVIGAACYTFNCVCPDDFGIIHKHFRKLCRYLVDCDEWGQAEMIKLLLRYSRKHFLSPFNKETLKKQKFYESSSEDDYEDEPGDDAQLDDMDQFSYQLDDDHRLLLTSCQPLTRSQNSGVVLQVLSLFYHIAPPPEFESVFQSVVALLSMSPFEDQYTILNTILSMAKTRSKILEPYLKDFFIFASDPLYIKKLKLKIISLLASEETVHMILGEFKTYLRFPGQEFVAEVIPRICEIAKRVPDICESCVHGLLGLLGDENTAVVSSSIIGLHGLIQQVPDASIHSKVIYKLCTLLESEFSHSPSAKSVIVWMIGEYHEYVKDIAPDALRILAKSFPNEESVSVQLQVLTLGTKLFLKMGSKVELLYKYVLNLARYSPNYDVRDRARFLRRMIFGGEKTTQLAKEAEKLLFSASTQRKVFARMKKMSEEEENLEKAQFRLGSLSHLLGKKVEGYLNLPEFAKEIDEEAKDERKVYEEKGKDAEGLGEGEEEDGMLNSDPDDDDDFGFYDEDEEEGEWYEEEGEDADFWGEEEEGEGEWYEGEGEEGDGDGEGDGEWGAADAGEEEGEYYEDYGEEEGEWEEEGEYYDEEIDDGGGDAATTKKSAKDQKDQLLSFF